MKTSGGDLHLHQAEFVDIERQVHREAEGEDTITPLTNNVFLKQLSKLKHHGSTRSINSLTGSSNDTSNNNNNNNNSESCKSSLNNLNIKSLNSTDSGSIRSGLNNFIPESFLALFSPNLAKADAKSSASTTNILANQVSQNGGGGGSDRPPFMSSTMRMNTCSPPSSQHQHQQPSTPSTNVTDQMFDVIKNVIENPEAIGASSHLVFDKEFLENVRLIVKHSDSIRKRKADKSIFMCRLAAFVFLALMAIMFAYFLKTVVSILIRFSFSTEFYLPNFIIGSANTAPRFSASIPVATTMNATTTDFPLVS